MVRGVVFFDVDGTLVPGTSSGQHLANLFGYDEVMREAEAGYAAGTLSNRDVSIVDAGFWTGWTPDRVRPGLDTLPLVEGIPETVAWCRDHDLMPVLATLAWDVVGAYLCERFGFDRACGPSLELVDGGYTGRVAVHFDEWGKRDFAGTVAADLGVDLVDCAAVGDSRSDLPLFAAVGLAVGFNATPAVRAVAHRTVDGSDLRVVIPVLADWLGRAH